MAAPENWDLIANLFINPKNIDDLEKQFTGALSGATKKWLDREVRGPVAKALSSGLAKGLREGLTGGDINRFVTSQVGDMQQEIERLLRSSMVAQQAGHTAQSKQLEAQAQKMTRQLQQQTAHWQREEAIYARAAENMQADQVKTARTVAKTWEQGADKAGNMMAAALRGDAGGIMGGVFGAMKGSADKSMQKGEGMMGVAQKGGKGSAGMMAAGKGMAAGGARLNMIVKTLEMVYKMFEAFIALDEQIVGMNRTILDGFGIADMGLTRAQYAAGELDTRIENIRDATTGMNEQFEKYGVTWKDQQGMLKTLNETGLTWQKIEKGASNAEDRIAEYGETMNRVAVYARVLGTNVSDMAGKFGEFAIQTGFDDRQIAEGFSAIAQEAQNAGFATKRFYNAVTEASAEMSLWGFRIAETAQLMGTMGKLIGQKFGQDLAATVQKSFQQGPIENFKDILLRDQEFVAEEFGKEFNLQLDLLGKQVGGGDLADQLQQAVMSATDEGDLAAYLKTIPKLGVEREEQALRTWRTGQAAAGDNPAAMARSMGEAGPGMAAIMRMRTTAPVQQYGGDIGTAISEAAKQGNLAALDVIEKTSGLDRDAFEELRRVAVQSSATLESINKFGIESNDEAASLGLFMKNGVLMRGTIAVDPKTKLQTIDKDNAVEVKDSNDILRGMLQDDEDLAMAMKSDREVAESMAKNTKSVKDAIDQMAAGVMSDMYDELKFIADMIHDILGKFTDARRSTRQQSAKAGKSLAEVEAAKTELAAAQESGDAGKIKAAEQKLAKAQEEMIAGTAGTTTSGSSGGGLFGGTAAAGRGKDTFRGAKGQAGAEREAQNVLLGKETTLANEFEEAEGWENIGAFTKWGFKAGYEASIGKNVRMMRAGFNMRDPLAQESIDGIDGLDPEMIKRMGGEAAMVALAEKAGNMTRAEIPLGTEGTSGVSQKERDRFNEILSVLMAENISKYGSEGVGDDFLQQAEKVDDALIRPNQRPILLHDKDDLLAMKPGGAVAQALEGLYATGSSGKSGNVSVNVFGGNQSDVYATVMKALKAAGLA